MTSYLALIAGRIKNQAFPYDLGLFFPGKPTASQLLASITAVRAFSFAANFAGSVASCGVAPTASTSVSITKNGTAIGTITFAAGATTATFTGSAVSFAIGDVLGFLGAATADATFANFSATLTGTR